MSLTLHARERLAERASIGIKKARKDIIAQIRGGTAQLIEKITNNKKKFRVYLEGKPYFVIYSCARHTIVTVYEDLKDKIKN